jgi:hypothetical protein
VLKRDDYDKETHDLGLEKSKAQSALDPANIVGIHAQGCQHIGAFKLFQGFNKRVDLLIISVFTVVEL